MNTRSFLPRVPIRLSAALLAALGVLAFTANPVARACPFCTSVAQTFTEEMNSMQVVALGRLIEAPPVPESASIDPTAPLPRAKFQVTEVIKGGEWLQKEAIVEVLYFGDANKERSYLLMATSDPKLPTEFGWSTPLGLTDRAVQYITHLPKLPADASRLEFFQNHLEDEDEMLTRDSYDEFAKAPYKDVIALGPKMHRDKLLSWVQDENVPASRKRLYYTMLGVCGKPEDAVLLEKLMLSEDRKAKAGLDAMIACFLLLKGADGLQQVEDQFLKNAKAEYADTYAAIMAIRFHGTEVSVVSKSRLVESLRYLLDRPELADLVIPDLAKWEDWAVMPRLVQLFKEADDKSSWVRVPVINYLRLCPLPEAKQAIEELAKIDPDAVKRAQTFFPLDQPPSTTPGNTAAKPDEAVEQPKPDQSSALVPPMPASVAEVPMAQPQPPLANWNQAASNETTTGAVAPVQAAVAASAEPQSGATATSTSSANMPRTLAKAAVTKRSTAAPSLGQKWLNQRWIWSVPVVASVLLWGTFRSLLGVRPWTFRA